MTRSSFGASRPASFTEAECRAAYIGDDYRARWPGVIPTHEPTTRTRWRGRGTGLYWWSEVSHLWKRVKLGIERLGVGYYVRVVRKRTGAKQNEQHEA